MSTPTQPGPRPTAFGYVWVIICWFLVCVLVQRVTLSSRGFVVPDSGALTLIGAALFFAAQQTWRRLIRDPIRRWNEDLRIKASDYLEHEARGQVVAQGPDDHIQRKPTDITPR